MEPLIAGRVIAGYCDAPMGITDENSITSFFYREECFTDAGRNQRLTTRFHHMMLPVTNMAAGTMPKKAQVAYANFRIRDKTDSSTALTVFAFVGLLAGTLFIFYYEIMNQPMQMVFIVVLYVLLTLGSWLFSKYRH